MAARVCSLLRQNIFSKLYFSNTVLRKSRAFGDKKALTSFKINSFRNYASKSPDSGQDPKHEFGTVITQSPLGWIYKKIYVFLLQTYFDPEFDEQEFLRGARQALIVTSQIIAERRFDDLSKLSSPNFIDLIKDAVKTEKLGRAIRAVDIVMAKIKNVHLDYTEKQTKQVEIDVTFVCQPEDSVRKSQVIGNVEIVHIRHPRIIEYRFRKFCAPDKDNWLVVGIKL